MRRRLFLVAAVLTAVACSSNEDVGTESAGVASRGRWVLPSSVLATGSNVRIDYDGAPKWTGTASCSKTLRVGARVLGQHLLDRFPAVSSIGGYACRRNTAQSSQMSVHGTGRALDVFIPKKAGGADSEHGDVVANWLVTNADRIGVQLIIWNRTVWRANGKNDAAYGGPHPHDDHVHVELTNEAAAKGTLGDAGEDAAMPDASADPAADAGAPIEEDAGAPTEPTEQDSGAAPSEPTEQGPVEEDKPEGQATEVPDDEPGETDSLGTPGRTRYSPREVEPSANAGCSAAPAPAGRPKGGAAAFFMALAAGIFVRGRRRRD